MPTRDVSAAELQDLIVHIGRVSCAGDPQGALTATQWTCLRFLSRANRATRTPSAFARFQATSRSTATQTIKSLAALGLLERRKVPGDGRSVQLELTPKGLEALQADPLTQMTAALDALPPDERNTLNRLLTRLADAMAVVRGVPSFGHCRDCSHFRRVDDRRYCSEMGEDIPASEVELFCDRFAPAAMA